MANLRNFWINRFQDLWKLSTQLSFILSTPNGLPFIDVLWVNFLFEPHRCAYIICYRGPSFIDSTKRTLSERISEQYIAWSFQKGIQGNQKLSTGAYFPTPGNVAPEKSHFERIYMNKERLNKKLLYCWGDDDLLIQIWTLRPKETRATFHFAFGLTLFRMP